MSFHTVHCTDLLFWLICTTDSSLAGIQVLRRDAPGFSGNEQIAGVLGKHKEVGAYVNGLYVSSRGCLPKDNSDT